MLQNKANDEKSESFLLVFLTFLLGANLKIIFYSNKIIYEIFINYEKNLR